MQRYFVTHEPNNPPQYLGGVGRYDVFYWQSAYGDKPRLIVKWSNAAGAFYSWNFDLQYWEDAYQHRADTLSDAETKTILAMYECFAVK